MEKKPAILFGTPQAPAAKGDRPKIVVAGEARSRIPCSPDQLAALDAGATPEVLAEALRVVNSINLDDHYFDDVVRFGADLQSEHGRLAEAQLALVSDNALAAPRADYIELIDRLEKLDPRLVFDTDAGAVARLKRLFHGGLAEAEFEQAFARIKQLAQRLEEATPAVETSVRALTRLSKRYTALQQSLAAHILACRYIIAHIDAAHSDGNASPHYQSQRAALENREVSLAATRATVEVGRQTLQVLAQGVNDLGLSSLDFTREELPAWYAAFSTALMARRTKSDAPGPLARVLKAHENLLSKLKRKEVP